MKLKLRIRVTVDGGGRRKRRGKTEGGKDRGSTFMAVCEPLILTEFRKPALQPICVMKPRAKDKKIN